MNITKKQLGKIEKKFNRISSSWYNFFTKEWQSAFNDITHSRAKVAYHRVDDKQIRYIEYYSSDGHGISTKYYHAKHQTPVPTIIHNLDLGKKFYDAQKKYETDIDEYKHILEEFQHAVEKYEQLFKLNASRNSELLVITINDRQYYFKYVYDSVIYSKSFYKLELLNIHNLVNIL
jgi:hypothetical protein